MRFLPRELSQSIYEYDPTYRNFFSQHVLPAMIEKAWSRIFLNIMQNMELFPYVVPIHYFDYSSDIDP